MGKVVRRSAPSGHSDGASQGLGLADCELAELLTDTQHSGEKRNWAWPLDAGAADEPQIEKFKPTQRLQA